MVEKKLLAVVTGATGQFSSYMIPFLLKKGYRVIGTVRRNSTNCLHRIKSLLNHPDFQLETVDILDSGALYRCISENKPDELYHSAAQSFVKLSWDEPYNTSLITGLGVTNVLEAVRNGNYNTKVWFAASSEMFGKVIETPQSIKTPLNPSSPYAAAKCYGYHMVKIYRESYKDFYCCSSIMFNNESKNRGIEFVTRKITDGVARIKLGMDDSITLGNLDAQRDWSHTYDIVRGAWLQLQQDIPQDFVFSSNETHSIREFLSIAFARAGIDNWEKYIKQDERFMRPNDVNLLLGDSSEARKILGWSPIYSFKDLVHEMVDADIERLSS